MANDKMIFPIGFDLGAAVEKAASDWDGKYADKLEKAIQKRALEVKLELSTKNFDSLDDVKKRLSELKLEPITPETKTAIKELATELRTLAKALEQVQKYSVGKSAVSPDAVRAARISEINQRSANKASIAHENQRAAAARAAVAEERLAIARDKSAQAATKTATRVNNLTSAYDRQTAILARLAQKLVAVWSINQVRAFITNIREVTAQFELQRVSLGAIIQDQTRANQLFSEIKQFALKSPVSILDLTKYTKQVAAYRIETDKLFDTTKRLADVSVGLGVDMGRLVLAYGQVKAASYLRAAEIRQFTEAGIPMLELLAEKFTKLNGEMVTTEQVMDMVSKRGVEFSMVEEIFNDMTSAGGMFYNMQEKQGNTLYGLWAKLGDAASVMYEQIGNTDSINKGMKAGIQALTDLMRNWQSVARGIAMAGIGFVAIKAQMKMAAVSATEVGAKTAQYRMELQRLQMQYLSTSGAAKVMTLGQIGYVRIQGMAATATIAFGNALRTMKAVLVSTGWGALAVAIGYVIEKLFFAKSSADKLKESLEKVYEETTVEQNKSVRNFEYLAKVATDATKGYKERKDALDELQRTYKDILPQEVLELEYLTKLKGNYDSLTNSIREYVAEQQRRKAIDIISEEYGSTKQKYEGKLTGYFRDEGWSEQEIARFWEQFYKSAADKSKTLEQAVAEAAEKGGHDGFETVMKLLKNQKNLTKDLDKKSYKATGLTVFDGVDYIDLLRDAVLEENQALEQNEERTKAAASAVSQFAEAWEKSSEKIANAKLRNSYGDKGEVDRDSYLGSQMLKNLEIKELAGILQNGFSEASLAWDSGFGNLINKIDASRPELISSLDFSAIINSITEKLKDPDLKDAQREFLTDLLTTAQEAQKKYMEIVPSDPVVRFWQQRFRIIANSVGEFQSRHNKYLIKAGEGLEGYNKRLKDELEGLKNNVKGLVKMQEKILKAGIFSKLLYGVSAEEVKKLIDEANEDIKMIEKALEEQPNFDKGKKSKSGGTKSDDRLSKLQEILSTLEKINTKYEELRKKEGDTKALKDIQKMYANTLEYANKLGKQFGLKFEMPTDFKDLQKARESVLAVIRKLKMKGYEKAALDLEEKIGTGDIDKLQKGIEKQLKELADRISRTKTAKEFYDKILSQTGDIVLASHVSTSIYGDDGFDLQRRLAEQIRGYFQNDRISLDIPIDVIGKNDRINYKRLGEFADEMKEMLGEEPYKAVKKIAEDGKKDMGKTWEGYFKDIEKAETYASKRIKLAQRTADKIAEIRADMAVDPELKEGGEKLIAGLIDKEMKEAAQLEWDAFKDTPLYVQMFEDLEQASTSTLEMMKQRIDALSGTWGSMFDPAQLKEMQSRMNEIDEQLRKRNPWKSLKTAYQEYKVATESVTLAGAGRNSGDASSRYYDAIAKYGADSVQANAAKEELEARRKIVGIVREITTEQGKQIKGQKALILAQQKAFDQEKIARGNLDIANAELIAAKEKAEQEGKNPATDAGVITVQKELDAAKERWEIAKLVSALLQKDVEKASKWRLEMENAATNIGNALTWAADIAQGIADIAEATGADEEDVQYYNEIASALGDITGGINDIISAATAGDLMGTISSVLTAIPKMFVGFTNLFSAGKIRKANKEIKRQQELLDQLEYTSGRLEKAAEKAFGKEYLQIQQQQRRALEAEIQAYEKQLEAERSKGKKADAEKQKEIENNIRDAKDELKDLEGKISEKILGSDVASSAKDFTDAWLDAYISFGNTADAIGEKFNDMVKNMVVQSVLAKVVEASLQPLFNEIEDLAKDGDLSRADIAKVVREIPLYVDEIDKGLSIAAQGLEAAGIDMSKLGKSSTGASGIAREFATASEESISGLTQMYSTNNFYVSQIHENVAMIRTILSANEMSESETIINGELSGLIQQSIENQAMIVRNTAETVVECRNIAAKCQEQTELLQRVIVPAGVASTYRLNVRL